MHTLFQALVKRTPSSGVESQSTVPPSPFAMGEMDEGQDDTEGSSAGKQSSLAAGAGSSATAAGLAGSSGTENGGGLEDTGALTSKSVEALAKQLEVKKTVSSRRYPTFVLSSCQMKVFKHLGILGWVNVTFSSFTDTGSVSY